MQIRCPGCQASYRIDIAALAAAHGQARCCSCETLFDATRPAADAAAAAGGEASVDVRRLLRRLQRNPPPPGAPVNPPLPLSLPLDDPGVPSPLQFASPPALDLDQTLAAPRRQRLRRLGQGLAVMALLALAAAQWAWIERDRLLTDPVVRAALTQLCANLPCALAPQRDPAGYLVLQRQLEPAADATGGLALRVSFVNQRDFAQPPPQLQLSLFDTGQSLLARRTLTPGEYLPGPMDPGRLVAAEEVITIEFRLADPGPHATGFELAFY